MDGYELGGRVLQANSHASAMFSRIATSPTSCLPLTFASLPRAAGPWFTFTFDHPLTFYQVSAQIGKRLARSCLTSIKCRSVRLGYMKGLLPTIDAMKLPICLLLLHSVRQRLPVSERSPHSFSSIDLWVSHF